MAEELQNLLDRIQRDGVEKAEARADDIVAAAEKTAADIVARADADARNRLAQAEKDAGVYTDRSRKALEQAARDIMLFVENAVTAVLNRMAAAAIGEALTPDVLKQMLIETVKAYLAEPRSGAVQVLLSPADEGKLKEFLFAEFQREMTKGLEIRADGGVISGFRVSITDKNVHHDFTGDAIAEALCRLIRPHLAEIVRGPVPKRDG